MCRQDIILYNHEVLSYVHIQNKNPQKQSFILSLNSQK